MLQRAICQVCGKPATGIVDDQEVDIIIDVFNDQLILTGAKVGIIYVPINSINEFLCAEHGQENSGETE